MPRRFLYLFEYGDSPFSVVSAKSSIEDIELASIDILRT